MPESTKAKIEAADFLSAKDLKKILELGKGRGVLTYEELNDLIPADVVEAAKLDAIMEFLADNDVEVDESPKARADSEDDEDAGEESELDEFLKKKQTESSTYPI